MILCNKPLLFLVLTLAPFFKRVVTVSVCPYVAANIRLVPPRYRCISCIIIH